MLLCIFICLLENCFHSRKYFAVSLCRLRTTLCLQYKPHYIAAGSLYIAAKIHNVKLPSGKDYAWWNEFDVTPKQLNG